MTGCPLEVSGTSSRWPMWRACCCSLLVAPGQHSRYTPSIGPSHTHLQSSMMLLATSLTTPSGIAHSCSPSVHMTTGLTSPRGLATSAFDCLYQGRQLRTACCMSIFGAHFLVPELSTLDLVRCLYKGCTFLVACKLSWWLAAVSYNA